MNLKSAVIALTVVTPAAYLIGAVVSGQQNRRASDSVCAVASLTESAQEYYRSHGSWPPVTASEFVGYRTFVESSLGPHVPLRDGWNRQLVVEISGPNFTVRSAGEDGELDRTLPAAFTPRARRGADLVTRNGEFLQLTEDLPILSHISCGERK